MSNRVYTSDCPQCGPGAAPDEDGCCAGCGATLCGRIESLRARISELEKEYGELAHAVGICHEQSMGACHPGPHEAILAQIRGSEAALVAAEALIAHEQARAAKAEAERDRYLAAIRKIGDDRAFIRGDWDTRSCEVRIQMETWQALRRIAEEAP